MTKIDPDEVQKRLTTQALGRAVVFYEQTGSTNTEAKRLGRQGAPHGALVLCARQTAGRGRRGRSWLSQEGALCMSLIVRPAFPMALAPRYVLALAVGVCRALQAFGAQAGVKWPNDVLVSGKKLSGILCEADVSGFVAAGIGVNVNQRAFPEELADTATSLACELGEECDINAVAAMILNECEPLLEACASEAGYAALLAGYEALSLTLGRSVRVLAPDGAFCGRAVELDALRMLEVLDDGGKTSAVSAGDVSIRGR